MKASRTLPEVTNQIIAQLEKGVAPWKRPWATVGGGFPKNAASGRSYRGMNVMLLWSRRRSEAATTRIFGALSPMEVPWRSRQ